MDVKSVSWVGDMYQKFEAMCLEVEDAMYQDTVKFVESQAKTVGTCVKRFYSDVMQDLLPLSSDDLVKPFGIKFPNLNVEQINSEDLNLGDKDKREEKFLPSEILAPTISRHGGTCEGGKILEETDENKKYVASTSIISSSIQLTGLDELENEEDASRVDGTSCDIIQDGAESDSANEQALQVSETGKMKLEELCILVNKYESFSPSHQESKQRSYKKKIKDVLYMRSWSRSKNKVHESGSDQMNRKNTVPASSPEPGNTSVQCNESFESGWEIL